MIENKDQKIYILVHGAWHGSWCWAIISQNLEKQGHKVISPDLPGHGINSVNANGVDLDTYVDFVCDLVLEQKDKVTLVGHSMAGVIISCISNILNLAALTPTLSQFPGRGGRSAISWIGSILNFPILPPLPAIILNISRIYFWERVGVRGYKQSNAPFKRGLFASATCAKRSGFLKNHTDSYLY